MVDYLREHSVGDVLRKTLEIYRRNFRVIFLTYLLPTFPFVICQAEAQAGNSMGMLFLTFFLTMLASLIAYGAITIAVSDICLGNKPSVARSYRRVFSAMIGRLFAASLLQVFFIAIGLLLLVLPGIIAFVWLMFTSSIVVLEGLGPFSAIKRSKTLAKGYHLRNFGVMLLVIIILMVIGAIIGLIFGFFAFNQESFAYRLSVSATQSLTAPMMLIATILLYYDLRVRKEAYDATALAEDLRR